MNVLVTRTRRTIAAVVVGVLLALGAPALAFADSNDDLVAVDTSLTGAVSAFGTVYGDQSASIDEVIAAAQTFETDAQKAQDDFTRIASAGGSGEVSGFATKFASAAGGMSAAAGSLAAAFTAQDSDAVSQGENDMNSAIDAYQSAADDYNAYLKTAGDPSYVGWLIVLIVAVVFLALTLVFALLTRKQSGLLPAKADRKGNIKQASLKRLRWMVVLWAAVFVVGAAIPFFQVAFAQPDASGQYSYRILWYPLAAGAILSIVGVIQYFVAAAKVRREGSAEQRDTVTLTPTYPGDPGAFGAVAPPQPQWAPPVPPAGSTAPAQAPAATPPTTPPPVAPAQGTVQQGTVEQPTGQEPTDQAR